MAWTGGLRGVVTALASLALVGCGANYNSIYRHQPIATEAPSLTAIDAKQRVILATPVVLPPKAPAGQAAGNSPEQRMRFCVEASPDVFSVLAQAASGTGSFGKTADPKAVQLAASLAYSSSETGATIARTQAVNLLRESMYRTCERYLNGGIGDLELTVQNVRDQRAMISVLAIEQLTNATRPRVVSLGGGGSAAAGASSQEATIRIDDAYKALQAANGVATQKQGALDKLNETTPTCAAIKTKVDAGTTLETAETAKRPDCDKATTALKAATDDRDAKAAHYKALQAAVNQGGGGPASAETSSSASVSDQTGSEPSAAGLAAVSKTVETIVLANFKQDEILLLCLKILPGGLPTTLATECGKYIQASIERESAEVATDTARLGAEKVRLETEARMTARSLDLVRATAFDRFWAKVAQAGDPDLANADELGKIVDAYLKAHPKTSDKPELQKLRGAKTRAAAMAAFGKLQQKPRDDLGK